MKNIAAAILVILLMSPLQTAANASTPTDQLKESLDGVISILRQSDLDLETKRVKISDIFRERFEFRIMSRRVLARNWKNASPEIQERFVKLFTDLLEATYVGRIEEYSDEKIDYIKEQIKEKRAVIDTVIVSKTLEIPINYKLALINGKWLVYDVVIEEVSLVRSFRSSYAEIVKKDGFETLLVRMEDKIQELKTSKKGEDK